MINLLSSTTCNSIAQYPLKVVHSCGSLLSGQPLICGGYAWETDSYISKCYIHSPDTNIWTQHAQLRLARIVHASVSVPEGVWFTGGYDGENWMNTTEIVYKNGTVVQGPQLPTVKADHCMVDLQDGRYMFIGGWPERKEVLIFDWDTKTFSRGPSIIKNRRYHGCTLFHSPLHENRPVVVTMGGFDERSSEILDFTNPDAVWQQSKLG